MVILSRIYTRTGDDGTTDLGSGARVVKTDARLAAYADVDEANSALGVVLATAGLPAEVAAVLTGVSNDLFDVGADLCTPLSDPELAGDATTQPLRVRTSDTARLERAIDYHNADLPVLRSFVLPGGSPGAAALHVARAVVRRAERSVWAAAAVERPRLALEPARYLNRLSDLLFVLARVVNASADRPDVLWQPGGERH